MSKFIDLSGQRFGKLTVLSRAENDKDGRVRFHCECDCGHTKIILSLSLKSGNTTSCGCSAKGKAKKHGMSYSKEYDIWAAMIQRCTNINKPNYQFYGGRGITVCDRWLESFENFYADMGDCPEGYSIDRIDNQKWYSPKNCRWVDSKTQNNNRRDNVLVTFNGETKTLTQWAEIVGITWSTLRSRIFRYGWSVEEALTTPARGYTRS